MHILSKRKFISLLFIILIFFSINAHAEINSADLLDKVLRSYETASKSWASIITTAASWLFWTLTIISMVWTFGLMALRKADIGEFFAEFIKFIMFTGFYWWLLINAADFAGSIYQSLRQLGGTASGVGSDLSPSGIVDVGFAIVDRVIDNTSYWSLVNSQVGLITAEIILVILALVAINMLLLLASAWILAYGGIFFLGFGGSRWTSDMAITYYKTVLGVAVQLMTMALLVGIGKDFLDEYYLRMSKEAIQIKELGVIFVVAILLFTLVNKIPPLISGIINGSGISASGSMGNLGVSSLVSTASMTAAAAAAAASGGASLAANAAGAASALMAAFSKSSEAESGSSSKEE